MEEFIFGTFAYEYKLIRQDRKTLSLTVTPDLHIILKCPRDASKEKIDIFLKKKWFWLEKQLSFFRKYQRKIYEKEYISGEGYLYLGRQYKLTVRRGSADSITLAKGQLVVVTTHPVSEGRHNRKIIDSWFEQRTDKIFHARFSEMLERFDYKNSPGLIIREMKKRWGSFLNQNKICLNPKLIHASRECIDYVIVHELCHLKYKNHDKRFHDLLKKKYPKWEKIKEKLEMYPI